MNHFAYINDWILNKNPNIDPAHVSKYIEKTIALKPKRLDDVQK